jgi:hypothetical protein
VAPVAAVRRARCVEPHLIVGVAKKCVVSAALVARKSLIWLVVQMVYDDSKPVDVASRAELVCILDRSRDEDGHAWPYLAGIICGSSTAVPRCWIFAGFVARVDEGAIGKP